MLYIVATPIGNLGEITYRAVEVLKEADAVLCEDTRRTAVLLSHYGISRPLVSYQKFNERERTACIIERLESGERLALVSDAGMPIISDPGSVLLSEVIAKGLEYTVISGPCALINAVVLSGLDASSFCMAGFMPERKNDRLRYIDRFASLESTLVFYSPPHNVIEDLEFLYSALGDRRFAVVREISKLHEEVVRGRLSAIPELTVRGEFVIVVEGAAKKENELNALSIDKHVDAYIADGLSKKDAMKRTATDRGISKSEVYAEYERIRAKENK